MPVPLPFAACQPDSFGLQFYIRVLGLIKSGQTWSVGRSSYLSCGRSKAIAVLLVAQWAGDNGIAKLTLIARGGYCVEQHRERVS